MTSQKTQINIAFSKDINLFAKSLELKCKCGEDIGHHKVFRVLRRLGFLNNKNIPHQNYLKYFELGVKNLANGY